MLECKNIAKHYDGVAALRDVGFTVRPGEVHALCGENGAGKSTLAKIIAGVVRPDDGSLEIDGRPVSISRPADARALGIGIVFQELDLFGHLTVADNMLLGHAGAGSSWRPIRRSRDAAFCLPYLRRVGLAVSPRTLLGSLGIAEIQLVAIARALAMRAKILLLDEPTSALTEDAAERLLALILELKRSGTGIVYVSHKMKEIFRIADRVTVLRDGSHVSTKEVGETSIGETIHAMVGREVDLSDRIGSMPGKEIALRVRGLRTARLREVSFEARRGEVLAIAGLVGSGRSSLGEALCGLDPWTGGEVEYRGGPYRPRTVGEAIRSRFAYLPEDRRTQGLFLGTSVRRNASAAILPRLSRFGFPDCRREKEQVTAELARTRTKAARDTLPVGALSGGGQQKVLLAKWLLTDPEVIYLDDPTRGIDIGAKADIYRIVEALSAAGKTVLFASSELPELLRCSHRILVLHEGRSVGLLETASATQERIMELASGHDASV